jgi:exodeoxyribonuclease VII large subunit
MSFADQLGFTFQAATRRIWTVHDLVAAVRTQLEREYTDVWVQGEISNFRPAESGHLYFTLKDDGAQLRVVMFRLQARLLRFRPENGLRVIARGRVTVYEDRGELQLSAEFLEPRGAGALQIAFEQLKAKLAAEGLFEQSRKKPVPLLPRRVGVITSPRGAALHDILNVLRRRHESVSVLIYPAQVQGESAAGEVAAGIRFFNRAARDAKTAVDVIVVARGGGSAEDLAAFNNERLARAVAESKLPVISAVGHETDFTILDFVADLRAPTPSAAAELVVHSKQQVEELLAGTHSRLGRAARYRVLLGRNVLAELTQRGALGRVQELVNRRQQRLDDVNLRLLTAHGEHLRQLRRRLEQAGVRLQLHDLPRRLSTIRNDLETHSIAASAAAQRLLRDRRRRVDENAKRLNDLSPLKVLDRGYALIFDSAGNLLKDANQAKPGDEISARLSHGNLAAKVTKTSSQ